MRAITAVLAAGVLLGATGADAVAAQPRQIAPGVFADPSTPAGKEYALQLQQARSTGASSHSTQTRAGSSLFGAGIAPKPTQRAAPVTPAPSKRSSTRSSTRARAGPPATAPSAPPAVPAVAATGGDGGGGGGGGGGTLALVGGAAAILALGGLGGILLRRRRPLEPDAERRIG